MVRGEEMNKIPGIDDNRCLLQCLIDGNGQIGFLRELFLWELGGDAHWRIFSKTSVWSVGRELCGEIVQQ